MEHYSKIKRLGHGRNNGILHEGQIILKEKLDGSNFRFTVTEDGEFLFGSRRVDFKSNGEPDYDENFNEMFKDAISFVQEECNPEKVKEKFGTNYTFFGENMVSHSLQYDWENTPQVIGFDIYDEEKEEYLKTERVEEIFDEIGIPVAPKVKTLSAMEFNPDEFEVPESSFRDGKMEGVVIINEDLDEDNLSGFSTRAKLVTEEFKEKKGNNNSEQENVKEHELFVNKYCTEGRIRKHIHKMREEGRELEMEMMENKEGVTGLPMRVAVDIVEEEARELVRSNQIFNWKEYRSMISKECVNVLHKEIKKK